ncbi:hypothetical protein QJS10_CPB18g00945 [Acorus calamus]|uniref:DUF8040 domain-containing protein n=1 Tax=Acorus calamus TaxID=4465 RepID=A0AAV9CJX4_ACOCL|nr:hypothetical protein QJS10_CPB18g00945 [Acorus calamus]
MREIILADELDWDLALQYIMNLLNSKRQPRISRRVCRTGELSGHVFIHELLGGNEVRSYKNFRMTPQMFFMLRDNLIGWEGSVGDMKVLQWALHRGGFSVPEAPYRGNRYHLSEFENQGNRLYAGPSEIFNHRHAQSRLCNVVERGFGV